MIDGREPNYICLDTRVMRLVRRLNDADRLSFMDGFLAAYDDKLSGTRSSAFPDNMVGDLLRQAAETMSNGFDAYMGRANANPEGKNGRMSMTGHRPDNDTQSNQDQINQDQTNQDQINQIKQQLIAEGYDGSEIEAALIRSKGKCVRDLAAYIRRTIENERRQGKRILPAQDFAQRDYSGVEDELLQQLAEDMEHYKEEQQEGNK